MRKLIVGLVLMLTMGAAQAVVCKNFYSYGWSGSGIIAVQGNFCGTPQANGNILKADLTSFVAYVYTGTSGPIPVTTFNLAHVNFFTYRASPAGLEPMAANNGTYSIVINELLSNVGELYHTGTGLIATTTSHTTF